MRFRGVKKVPGCHVDTGRIGCKRGAEGEVRIERQEVFEIFGDLFRMCFSFVGMCLFVILRCLEADFCSVFRVAFAQSDTDKPNIKDELSSEQKWSLVFL